MSSYCHLSLQRILYGMANCELWIGLLTYLNKVNFISVISNIAMGSKRRQVSINTKLQALIKVDKN